MNLHGLALSSMAIASLVMPCGRLPGNLTDVVDKRMVTNAVETAGEVSKCDKLATAPVALEEEQAVGQTAALQIIREGGLTHAGRGDPSLRALNRLGMSLALLSDRPSLEWTFGILNDDGVNAFATPGGYVFVTRGLLRTVENEAQLAGVLAHEISHVTHQHALEQYRPLKAKACQNAAYAGFAADQAGPLFGRVLNSNVGFIDFNDAANKVANELLQKLATELTWTLANKGYPPSDEIEADQGAVSLMVAAGYDPTEYRTLLARLPAGENLKNHPPTSDRVKSVDRELEALAADPLRKDGAPFGKAQGFRAPPLNSALASSL